MEMPSTTPPPELRIDPSPQRENTAAQADGRPKKRLRHKTTVEAISLPAAPASPDPVSSALPEAGASTTPPGTAGAPAVDEAVPGGAARGGAGLDQALLGVYAIETQAGLGARRRRASARSGASGLPRDLQVLRGFSGETLCVVPVRGDASVLHAKAEIMRASDIPVPEQRLISQAGLHILGNEELVLGKGATRSTVLLVRLDWREVVERGHSPNSLRFMGGMDRAHALEFLQRIEMSYQAARGELECSRRMFPELMPLVGNLDATGVTKRIEELPPMLPELRSLKCKIEVGREWSSVGAFKHLRSLELSFAGEGSRSGLEPLLPLAGTLELLDIGTFYGCQDTGLKVLEELVQLRVLRFSGANRPDCSAGRCGMEQEVLDLRRLCRLEELVFEGTDFTAPYCARAEMGEALGTENDARGDPAERGPGGPRALEAGALAQGLATPEQLPAVTFNHLRGCRITPGLRRYLRASRCEPREYLQVYKRAAPSWGLFSTLQSAMGEPVEYKKDTRRRPSFWHFHQCTGRWARWTGDQIEAAELRMVEEQR